MIDAIGSRRKAWILTTTLRSFMCLTEAKQTNKPRLLLYFSSFLFPPKERGKKKRRLNSKNRDQKSCLSARSCYNYPTKHLCILVPLPLWHLICINFLQWCRLCPFLGQIYFKFGANLSSKFWKMYVETAPSNGAIWDEFSEQHCHQCIKSTIFNARSALI